MIETVPFGTVAFLVLVLVLVLVAVVVLVLMFCLGFMGASYEDRGHRWKGAVETRRDDAAL